MHKVKTLMEIISESLSRELERARRETNTNPTDGQKEADNYKKGRVAIHGFKIAIENPKGSYRKGKNRDGKEWKTLMHNDYGYFVRTLGKDGDAIDVFIGPNLKSEKIFPIDQYINGEFDETKVMLGFDSAEQAKKAYLSNYEKDWKGFKYITEVGIEEFRKWLYDGYRQRKPFAKYKSLNEAGGKYAGWLRRLKKRRDPANIENWEELNESLNDLLCELSDDYMPSDLLYEFLDDKRNGITRKKWNLIPAQQYHTLLKRYMQSPEMARIPGSIVNHWFKDIIAPNALTIEYITEFAGHSSYFPGDDMGVVFGTGENDYIDYGEGAEILEKEGFYDWCKLPDGSDGWSDYGLQPIFKLMGEYNENANPSETLILINRILDIGHQRGDLASAFIEGGSKSCDYISNSLNEALEN